MIDFESAKSRFEQVCQALGVPVPLINPSLGSDPCDFTSHREVRLNVEAASPDLDLDYYVRHNVGHYLCEWEAWDGSGADMIADVIAELLLLRKNNQ